MVLRPILKSLNKLKCTEDRNVMKVRRRDGVNQGITFVMVSRFSPSGTTGQLILDVVLLEVEMKRIERTSLT